MDIEIWKTLAASYESAAISLGSQADAHGTSTPMGAALLTASYTAGVMRNAALDVVEMLEKKNGR